MNASFNTLRKIQLTDKKIRWIQLFPFTRQIEKYRVTRETNKKLYKQIELRLLLYCEVSSEMISFEYP